MAAAQTIKSVSVENVIGYYMAAYPSAITYISGTDDLLSKWGAKRLEPLIDSLGIRHKMMAQIDNEQSRLSGDNKKQKLFTGGFLEMGSAQSPSSLRADTVKILILEECDSAPQMLVTGEGRWDQVVEARTKAFGNRRKIMAVSTPTLYDQSIIHERFLLGDQCEYFVPCPLCGKFQLLDEDRLRAETIAGDISFIYLMCDHCNDAIMENRKNEMIIGGKWEPQAKPEKFRRSFHLNSLYSASGMYSWYDYYISLQKVDRDPNHIRAHTNLQKGLPYRETGRRPKAERIMEQQGHFDQGTVPDGVLYLTMGVDVQRGSEKDPSNPPRLEAQVLGIGPGYRNWSIDYHRIEGAIMDPFSGAWEKLYQWAISENAIYKRHDGLEFRIRIIFVDSGDGKTTDIVYRFCDRLKATFPIKGFSALVKGKKEKKDMNVDPVMASNFKRYRHAKVGGDQIIYEISTNYYKKHIYNNLRIPRVNEEIQRPGFIDFPKQYEKRYFDMLTAEDLMSDGSFEAGRRRNEALDNFVYAMCAGDVWLDSYVLDLKAKYKANGVDQMGLANINHRFVIAHLCHKVGLDPLKW
jgi:phage terminase large subunit GpA-like protein